MRLSHLALGCLAATTSSACSALVSPTQCGSDGDCTGKGSAFANTVCSAGLCVTRDTDKSDASIDTDGAAPVDECVSTAACIMEHGEHSVCLMGRNAASLGLGRRCTELTSEDCSMVFGKDGSENPFVLGMLVDTTAAATADLLAGAALAVNDFQQAVAGVLATPGEPPRSVVLVACAEENDALRAAHHLVDTLAVPAILGPSSSERLLEIAAGVTVPAGTLLLSASASSAKISSLAADGLVLRTAPPDPLVGKVMALVSDSLGIEVTRVAAVSTQDDLGDGLLRGLEGTLALNGKTLAQNEEGGDYLSTRLATKPTADEVKAAAKRIANEVPQVIALAGGAGLAPLLEAIESAWPASADERTRATYLLAEPALTQALSSYIARSPDTLRVRIRVAYPGNTRSSVFQIFRRFLASSQTRAPLFFEAAKAYDAVYLMGLAAIPPIDPTVSGRTMARAIGSFLMRGDRIDVGAVGLPGAVARLSVESVLDLEGASGPLDFDRHGDVETGIEIGCLEREGASKLSLSPSSTHYRAATTAAKGALIGAPAACP